MKSQQQQSPLLVCNYFILYNLIERMQCLRYLTSSYIRSHRPMMLANSTENIYIYIYIANNNGCGPLSLMPPEVSHPHGAHWKYTQLAQTWMVNMKCFIEGHDNQLSPGLFPPLLILWPQDEESSGRPYGHQIQLFLPLFFCRWPSPLILSFSAEAKPLPGS